MSLSGGVPPHLVSLSPYRLAMKSYFWTMAIKLAPDSFHPDYNPILNEWLLLSIKEHLLQLSDPIREGGNVMKTI